ncbi:MAG: hypothetical protein SPD11_08130 [Sphaerochaetaceae bacterium]|nr:hypothetical protein [Sphaerochaetaceae bacterium]
MNKKIYICDVDVKCPDYIFTKEVVRNCGGLLSSLEDADLCLFNAGVYISRHSAKEMEKWLRRAIDREKQIIIIKPYGTSYMPLYFRRLKLEGIELLKSQIEAVLEGVLPDFSKLLLNRYC